MKKIKSLLAVLVMILVLAGCAGKSLPDSMTEEELIDAGREVMLLAVEGDYEAVHALLREDIRETVTAEDIQSVVLNNVDGAGVYKQIEDSMTTAQDADGETIGVAVLYCEYSEDNVLFRVAFDSEMKLVGLSVQKQ